MYDVYTSYFEVNEAIDFSNIRLSNDVNVEDPALIVGVRKWIDSGLPETGPEWPLVLGYRMAEYVKVNDKYDLFIYENRG